MLEHNIAAYADAFDSIVGRWALHVTAVSHRILLCPCRNAFFGELGLVGKKACQAATL